MPHLALYLLGSPRLEMDGKLVPISRRKVMALLVYLAVTGRRHQRDTLAALLWPEYDTSRARADLRRTLSVLNRTLGGDGIIADRESAELNPELGLWLDVDAFQQKLAKCKTHDHPETEVCTECVSLLEQAVTLYCDDFLAGFTLEDSAAFDEWQFFQTEGLRNSLGSALEGLVRWYSEKGESGFEQAISYTRRWLALDPLHEAAHRQLMTLYAQNGQRSAALRQYRQCVRILEEELGVAPTVVTTTLYDRIRAERAPQKRVSPTPTPKLPLFLSEEAVPSPAQEYVFVARESELARLDSYLDTAIAGQGQVTFIMGGPGRGKTALMREFARQMMASHPELLVVNGNCNAYAGIGDPYLPFREVIGMLSGDVEARWAAGMLSRVHAKRLWEALPQTLPILVQHGSFLIDNLVSGAELLSRSEHIAAKGKGLVKELQALIEGPRAIGLQQQAIFQQVTNVLGAVSDVHPLLIILDDLQWADTGSIGVLFHLGRRLVGKRILLICAYRPEEVAAGRDGERHPLEKVLSEFQREYGDVWIDLRQVDEKYGHEFVDALLDTESNRLDKDFREALAVRTEGHPLFTVELLRAMQTRGDLVRGPDGVWIEGTALMWETLPTRVKAVIGERLARLSEEQRDLLAVACVEGETFTVQVVVQVLGLEEWVVLRLLSQNLATRHRLVREVEEVRADGQFLSRYQFAHALFQDYLYRELSDGERRLLHGEIAMALEGLYGEKVDSIASHLAHHYDQAGQFEKAIKYLLKAAEQARLAYAHDEVIGSYRRILALLEDAVVGEAGKVWRFKALCGLGKAHFHMGRVIKAEKFFREALTLGRDIDLESRELVRIYYWLGETLVWQDRPDEMARIGQEGLALLENDVESIEGALMSHHIVMGGSDREKQIKIPLKTAQFIQRVPYVEELRAAYEHINIVYRNIKNVDKAMRWCDILEERAKVIHDLRGQATAVFSRGQILYLTGDFCKAVSIFHQTLESFTRIGEPGHGGWSLWAIGISFLGLGCLQQAENYFQQWYEITELVGFKRDQLIANINLGLISLCRHHLDKARDFFQKALSLSQDIEDTWLVGWSYYYLGRVYQAKGEKVEAKRRFHQALVSIPWSYENYGYLAEDRADFSFSWPHEHYGYVAEVLGGLEETSLNTEVFHSFCRRFRREHPDMDKSLITQWFLQAVDARLLPSPSFKDDFTVHLGPDWVWYDQFDDCTYKVQNGLVIHAANGRALWNLNLSAPRVLQLLPPALGSVDRGDFVIQTVCVPVMDDRPSMGGLLIWKDKENYLRLDRGVFGKHDITFKGCVDNKNVVIGRGQLPKDKARERVFLWLEQRRTRVDAFCSVDGEQWYTVGHTVFPEQESVQVGVYANGMIDRSVYHGAYPDGTAIRFESFQLWHLE